MKAGMMKTIKPREIAGAPRIPEEWPVPPEPVREPIDVPAEVQPDEPPPEDGET